MGHILQDKWRGKHYNGITCGLFLAMEIEKGIGKGKQQKMEI